MQSFFERDIKYLPGVGPARSKLLGEELKIFTFKDLIEFYPYKYVDRSKVYPICQVHGDMPYIQLCGTILSFEEIGVQRAHRLVAHFSDDTGVIDLVWFKGIKYVLERLKPGVEYVVFGKPSVFGGRINISHPDIDPADKVELSSMGLCPSYSTTEKMKKSGLNSRAVSKLMETLLGMVAEPFPETLPQWIVARYGLMPYDAAIRTIHFPTDNVRLKNAQYRLKFEELFQIQLNIARYTSERKRKLKGFVFDKVGDFFNDFYSHNLPYQLTNAQKRVIKEIRYDTCTGAQMNRLLQGDVGSGKTMVALMTMLIAADNGFQACLMAPTEILAEQHFSNLNGYLDGLGLHVELLTGSIKGKRRERILAELADGSVHILVSTHAVLEENVNFYRLGMVVIDEQHRFGVEQRSRMWTKNTTPPHILVMTATPIPRTLAMTLYGDLDVSQIDELPPGRKPVMTLHRYDRNYNELYAFVDRELDKGRQIYFVFPLITESEKSDLKNLEDGYAFLCERFARFKVSMVHGKMKPADKDAQMQMFKSGESRILVATTVIEVGVDVPNASVMVIENAERFGLSQLHQLRGRVGRGADQSYCILVTGVKLTDIARSRMEIMTATTDGFEIAEADLKLRGPGDLEGTQQSGIAFDLKIANITKDAQIIQTVRELACRIVADDPELSLPENALLAQGQRARRNRVFDLSFIS
ncbi:MAG: ATP-dependent DNA helicase RecG [Bacteroidaceae bacterium]|nr:ATP-dependent DNA helicase RecG [Bacteroidaceae bacterium]